MIKSIRSLISSSARSLPLHIPLRPLVHRRQQPIKLLLRRPRAQPHRPLLNNRILALHDHPRRLRHPLNVRDTAIALEQRIDVPKEVPRLRHPQHLRVEFPIGGEHLRGNGHVSPQAGELLSHGDDLIG